MRILAFLILEILILLDGILGLFTKESILPLFKVILGPKCILLAFLLVLTLHIEMRARKADENDPVSRWLGQG